MPAKLLTGKQPADTILATVKEDVARLDPKLVIVQVGHDPASDIYVQKKIEACESVGMRCEHIILSAEAGLGDILGRIDALNKDPDVSGFIIQLPLPGALQDSLPLIMRAIEPKKDVDGFTAYNIGKMTLSKEFEHLPPATPAGIIELLTHYKIEVDGKHVVVIGRSNTVGKPLAIMLLNRGATVTVCHRRTKDLASLTKVADIVVCATGRQGILTADMVKKKVVVIDVGMNRTDAGLTGDADFDGIKKIASAITPVPGGVGPMTVACLLRNCVRAKERQTEGV